ncbi:MAG: REJ domain-containing protein, partial [Ginsengibacter sp.]
WSFVSGPAAVGISSANTAQTTVSNLTSIGAYIFRLTVTDEKFLTATDDVVVTIVANRAPVVEAGENITHVFSPGGINNITLNGSGSDPDGDPVTFLWSGPSQFSIQTPASASIVVSGLVPGAYNFVLTVTDSLGASATDNLSVNVIEPPIANAGDERTVNASENLTLDGSESIDPDGGAVSFNWVKLSGPAGETFNPALQNPVVTGLKAGTYVFELTVTDSDGLTSKDQVTINVNREAPQKSCAPLADIIENFKGLKDIDTADIFKNFTVTYQDYEEILAFYNEMEERKIATLSPDEQTAFFVEKKVEELLPKWINDLQNVIAEFFDLRLLGLSMLNIHAQFTYYIACIQKEDVDNAKASMVKALDAITNLLERIKPLLPNFNQAQREVLKKLLEVTETELARVKTNDEEASKPLYAGLLSQIIAMLKSFSL